MAKQIKDSIPLMDDPLGKGWDQPSDMTAVLLDETHAILSQWQLDRLCDYSRSMPSGVYPGKCWKSQSASGVWFLRWYGAETEDHMCGCYSREVIIVSDITPDVRAHRKSIKTDGEAG